MSCSVQCPDPAAWSGNASEPQPLACRACRDDSLRTALHWAAAHGLADIAQQLLSNAEAQMTSMQTSARSGDLDQVHVPPPLLELEVRQSCPDFILLTACRLRCSPGCICQHPGAGGGWRTERCERWQLSEPCGTDTGAPTLQPHVYQVHVPTSTSAGSKLFHIEAGALHAHASC